MIICPFSLVLILSFCRQSNVRDKIVFAFGLALLIDLVGRQIQIDQCCVVGLWYRRPFGIKATLISVVLCSWSWVLVFLSCFVRQCKYKYKNGTDPVFSS